MARRWNDEEALGAAIGSLLAIGVAAILGTVRGEVAQPNAALALVLVVIVAAVTGGRRAGVATGLIAAVSFDFFLTRPYLSLAIDSGNDVLTVVLLMAVGLAVGVLAASRREGKAEGQAGHDEVASIHRVAALTADGADTDTVIRATEAEVAAVLQVGECHFSARPDDPPLPELQPSGHVDAPYRYLHEGDGFALPAEGITVAVRSGPRTFGWLVCRPTDPDAGISADRRRTALVLADHLALAMASDRPGPGRTATVADPSS